MNESPPRRDGTPGIIDQNGRTELLQRLTLTEREISEHWLQERLHNSPQLLPVDEIDPSFSPLIPIGMEIGTPAGPIDNLYISPQGTLTVVEAKLWRNPEARRQVVGQILDYAKEISRWSYETICAISRKSTGKSLWEYVSENGGQCLEEARFIDAVSRNLKAGRFLLLIVGDGIREGMERLAEFLQESPQLRFTLALVELQIYKLPENERFLIMPLVVARTREITRAVVQVVSSEGAEVDVSIELATDSADSETRTRRHLTEEEFFTNLKTSQATEAGMQFARQLYDRYQHDARFRVDLGKSSYSLKVQDPLEPSSFYSLLVVQSIGRAYNGWLYGQLDKRGVNPQLAEQFASKSAKLLGCKVNPKWPDAWHRTVELQTLADNADAFIALIEELANAIIEERINQVS